MEIKHAHVSIYVSDLSKSIEFYQSLGFSLNQRWGEHYAQLTAPGIEIGLHPSNKADAPAPSSHISIGFTTSDMQSTKKALEKLGLNVTERREEGGYFLHFEDPNGTPLYFIEPKW